MNFANQRSQAEEFNPFYFNDKIDLQKVQNIKSNPDWKLNIKYQKYFEEFEKSIHELQE